MVAIVISLDNWELPLFFFRDQPQSCLLQSIFKDTLPQLPIAVRLSLPLVDPTVYEPLFSPSWPSAWPTVIFVGICLLQQSFWNTGPRLIHPQPRHREGSLLQAGREGENKQG